MLCLCNSFLDRSFGLSPSLGVGGRCRKGVADLSHDFGLGIGVCGVLACDIFLFSRIDDSRSSSGCVLLPCFSSAGIKRLLLFDAEPAGAKPLLPLKPHTQPQPPSPASRAELCVSRKRLPFSSTVSEEIFPSWAPAAFALAVAPCCFCFNSYACAGAGTGATACSTAIALDRNWSSGTGRLAPNAFIHT